MSLTFSTILDRLAAQVQTAFDETTGAPILNRQEEHRFTAYLNEAAAWIWRGKYQNYTLPDLITGVEVTLGTDGIIAAADIDNADFWTVWSSDPRLALPEDRAALALRATAKPNGDLIVQNGNAGDTAYVIHRTRIPKWTAVLASGFGSTVSIDTRLWNKLCPNDADSDGHVYRALIANASPDDFTDTASWLPVALPETLLEPITAKALSLRFRADGQYEAASQHEDVAERWMETRARAAEQQPYEKPWLYSENL